MATFLTDSTMTNSTDQAYGRIQSLVNYIAIELFLLYQNAPGSTSSHGPLHRCPQDRDQRRASLARLITIESQTGSDVVHVVHIELSCRYSAGRTSARSSARLSEARSTAISFRGKAATLLVEQEQPCATSATWHRTRYYRLTRPGRRRHVARHWHARSDNGGDSPSR